MKSLTKFNLWQAFFGMLAFLSYPYLIGRDINAGDPRQSYILSVVALVVFLAGQINQSAVTALIGGILGWAGAMMFLIQSSSLLVTLGILFSTVVLIITICFVFGERNNPEMEHKFTALFRVFVSLVVQITVVAFAIRYGEHLARAIGKAAGVPL